MKCEICGRSPAVDSAVVLTRANEKGVTGIWRCQYHPKKGYEPDPVVAELSAILNPERKHR